VFLFLFVCSFCAVLGWPVGWPVVIFGHSLCLWLLIIFICLFQKKNSVVYINFSRVYHFVLKKVT
jgi:hypothetical protein